LCVSFCIGLPYSSFLNPVMDEKKPAQTPKPATTPKVVSEVLTAVEIAGPRREAKETSVLGDLKEKKGRAGRRAIQLC
jgi:hypothetical protein